MRDPKSFFSKPFLPAIGLFLLLIGCAGCAEIVVYRHTPLTHKYQCESGVYKASVSNQNVAVTISSSPDNKCFKWHPPLTSSNKAAGLVPDRKVYCDSNVVVKKIGYDKIKGAGWITTRLADNNVALKKYLSFKVNKEVEGVYVAFDTNADFSKSGYTVNDYKSVKMVDSGGATVNAYITIASAANPAKERKMRLWRYNKKQQTPGKPVYSLESNFSRPTLWPAGFDKSKAAMYFVIVNPLKKYDTSTFPLENKLSEFAHPGCFKDKASAEKAANEACRRMLKESYPFGTASCASAVCTKIKACEDVDTVEQTLGLKRRPISYRRSSKIEFDPSIYPAHVTMEAGGKKFTAKTKGTLDFEYNLNKSLQMKSIDVQSMILRVDPINTPIGNFKKIVIDLMAPVAAVCTDKSPKFAKPCDGYEIQTNQGMASVSAYDGKGTILILTKNAGPIPVIINHTKRTLHIKGGPFKGNLKVNGKDTEFKATIDLTGHFLNFAPQAGGSESQKGSECVELYNRDKIRLDASTSFEIYGDTLPTNAKNYRWYEDFGLVTEDFLGTGKQHDIGSHSISYGIHQITLQLQDDGGVADTDTFYIDVYDTKAPRVSAPQDVFVLVPKNAGPTKVDIGKGRAGGDLCSDEVMVTNDAPLNRLFSPGRTRVIWTADDGRGNKSSATQRIYIFTEKDSILDNIREGLVPMKTNLAKSKSALKKCSDKFGCNVEFASLSSMMRQLRDTAKEMSASGEEESLRVSVIERLEPATVALEEATELLQQAQRDERGRGELRAEALNSLKRALGLMDEISGLPWQDIVRGK